MGAYFRCKLLRILWLWKVLRCGNGNLLNRFRSFLGQLVPVLSGFCDKIRKMITFLRLYFFVHGCCWSCFKLNKDGKWDMNNVFCAIKKMCLEFTAIMGIFNEILMGSL